MRIAILPDYAINPDNPIPINVLISTYNGIVDVVILPSLTHPDDVATIIPTSRENEDKLSVIKDLHLLAENDVFIKYKIFTSHLSFLKVINILLKIQ